MAARISAGSAIRPGRYSPHAIGPSSGPHDQHAIGLEPRQIALRRRVVPHPDIHRRRDQHRLVGCQKQRGGEVIGLAGRHLRHEIGGRRRDDHEVGRARQLDMPHLGLVGQAEEIVMNLAAATGRHRQRRHELRARPR